MDGLAAASYLAIFTGALLLALFLTPVALKVAVSREILDKPGGHKGHTSPVPYLGGLAIVVAFSLAILVAALLRPPPSGLDDLIWIVVMAIGLAVVGLLDDLRGLGPVPRLAVQIAAGVGLWMLGSGVQLTGNQVLDAALTILWIVGVTNSLNLLDNMDGLSAGVAAVGAVSFFVIAATHGQFLVAALSIALAGCAVGFLRHNFHPAKIYMGDAGSLFLGFMLAVVGIRLRFDGPTQVTFMVPILVLGVPIFDTVLVSINRIIADRSPLAGGRDHTSHRLVAVGFPVPAAVGLLYAAAASLGWTALVVSRVDRTSGFLLTALVGALAVFVGILLSRVPVYASSTRRLLRFQEVPDEHPRHRASGVSETGASSGGHHQQQTGDPQR